MALLEMWRRHWKLLKKKIRCTLCNGTGRIVKERHSENLITVRACPKCNKKGPVVNVGKINQEWMRKR